MRPERRRRLPRARASWAALAGLAIGLSGCGASRDWFGDASGAQTDALPPHRLVGIGYEDVVRDDLSWRDVDDRLRRVGATGVTIGVGRAEWVAFPWPAHEAAWSAPVQRTGTDYVQRAVDALRGSGPTARSITLTIDVLAPRRILTDPSQAAVSAAGVPSTVLLGPAALAGEAGEAIGDLCDGVASRYRPDRIALAELFIDGGYGAKDLEAFGRATGRSDWPRNDDGSIAVNDAELLAWRTSIITAVAQKCAERTRAHGVPLDVDVRSDREGVGGRPDSGQDYRALLRVADRLTVWNYFGLDDHTAADSRRLTSDLAAALGPADLHRVTVSVGLWALTPTGGRGALAPDDLAAGLVASGSHGVDSVSATPMSLFTDAHWAALERAWRPASGGAGGAGSSGAGSSGASPG